jgi:hypothetical protein
MVILMTNHYCKAKEDLMQYVVTRWLKAEIVKRKEMAIVRERSIKRRVKLDCCGNRGIVAVEEM